MRDPHRRGWARPGTLLLAVQLISCAIGTAQAASLVPRDTNWAEYFRIDWRADQRHGGAVVSGYITSVNKYGARWMQLLIDNVDASGQVVEQKLVWLPSELPRGGRVYFEAPVTHAADYRISVYAYESPPRP